MDQMVITAVYPGAAPLDVELNAVIPIERQIKKISGIKEYLNTIGGVTDIDDDLKEGKTEIVLELDYEKMAGFQLTVATIAKTVRIAYDGVVATSMQTTEENLEFRLKIDDRYKKDLDLLNELLVPNAAGRLIPLNQISTVREQKALSSLKHFDGDRVINLTANVVKGKTTSSIVTRMVKKKVNDFKKNTLTSKSFLKERRRKPSRPLKTSSSLSAPRWS